MPAKTQTARTGAMPKLSKPNFGLPSFSFSKESLVAGTNIPPPPREPSPAPPALQQQAKQQAGNNSAAAATGNSSNDPLRSHPTTPDTGATKPGAANGAPTSHPTAEASAVSSAADVAPGTKRPHHVRRLLSMQRLSASFNAGSTHGRSDSAASGSDFGPVTGRSRTPSLFGRNSTSTWGARPESRGGMSTFGGSGQDSGAQDGGKRSLKKRMSGAFWSRRNSVTLARLDEQAEREGASAAAAAAVQRKKTPPPQLPEIGKLKIGKELHNKDGAFLNGDDMFKGIEYKPEI